MCSRLFYCANILQIESKWLSFTRGEDKLYLEIEKNQDLFCILLDLYYLSPLVKMSGISKMKIKAILFCILLDLYYLCSEIRKKKQELWLRWL